MYAFNRDLRLAVRQLWGRPGYSAFAIASLAIGIGATTTIFALADAFLLRPLPLRDPGRLVYAYETSYDGSGFHSFSYPQYRDLRARTRTLSGLAAFDVAPLSVATVGDPQITLGLAVSGSYFDVLGTQPALGRFFRADEDSVPNRNAVAVVSHAFWRNKLGADSGAIGQTIRINGHAFTIVGVTSPGFAGVSPLLKPDVWTPLMMSPVTRPDIRLDSRGYSTFELVGRLANGVTRDAATSELNSLAKQIGVEFADTTAKRGVAVFPFTSLPTEARRGIAIFMALLMSFAALILVVACGNVASMMLARAVQRRREIAIRTALGAARARIVAQLATETVLLFVAGGGVAIALARAATAAISSIKPPTDAPIGLDFGVDARVMVFAGVVALAVGIVFAIVPALRATRPDLATVLRSEAGSAPARSRARAAVVTGQVAFTFVLLIAAGLVGRALSRALDIDPGFDPRNVYLASTNLMMRGADVAQGLAIADTWRERVSALPGSESAALTSRPPLGLGNSTAGFSVVADGAAPTDAHDADFAAVSPEYFDVMRVRLLAGRAFARTDALNTPPVTVVSAALAKRYFGGAAQAVGARLRVDAGDVPVTIVGVAADTKVRSLVEDPRAFIYRPIAQARSREVTLLVRTRANADVSRAVRAELRTLDADLPLISAMHYDDRIGVALLPQRLAAALAAVLGFAALLLAAVGVYGTVAYAVSQRTKEIGVRMALGASPNSVVGFMAAEGLRLATVGVAIGFVISFGATRVMRSFLLGISPTDPLTFGVTIFGFAAVALVACGIPARRAAAVDPMTALRAE